MKANVAKKAMSCHVYYNELGWELGGASDRDYG